ncbi:enoyl-CoA hydratase/isomerase family protein [Pacificimonas sp. WHA3]|uniref:Enoyl-CoA hydratase/isomerase family protein n=1 Tax=Pacificimonas pallii TaxID=2827236 RepID=A0ABS6SBM1_9SPHN|nr:enoyl-CoA hydratase-related protein [Pacificimonas pallii]MBV7255815.1 enoyl-CoA hydratase/isomerase family protein [Pacificimonas pallii]
MTKYLRLEKSGRIATLLIDRPEKKNAFLHEMWAALPGLVHKAMGDDEVRLLILRGAGGDAFSAGADIAEFGAKASDAAWGKANQSAIRDSQYALARAPKPTVSFIEGVCVGGGCGLSIACDLRVSGPKARFGITPARLGIVYSLHDTKLLVDLVGPAQAKRILFTAKLIGAAEAHRIGLVDFLSDDPAAALGELSEAILSASPLSIAGTKRNVSRILAGQSDDDEMTLAEFRTTFHSADYKEGVASFLGKREAEF